MKVAWFQSKLLQECVCGSGRPHRPCGLRRELACGAIVLLATVALFAGVSGPNWRTFALTVCAVLTAAGWMKWWIQGRFK